MDVVKIIKTVFENDSFVDRKIIREDFLQLAQSIIEMFPSEVKETYFAPFTFGHLAKGKLYDAYNNKRSRLSAAGVIRRRSKSKPDEAIAKRRRTLNIDCVNIDESILFVIYHIIPSI